MQFITFPVATTNIFPLSNSKHGGQLVTEFNLRSRETVATDPNVKYSYGPSYVHSMSDFAVSILEDESYSRVASGILSIAPGRGVINGHYVETKAPMIVDMLSANEALKRTQRPGLTGKLGIGFKIMYTSSAESLSMAGSMKVENADDMYEGIQVVVLPIGRPDGVNNYFATPSDCPNNPDWVTADILLATFEYYNGEIIEGQQTGDISGIVQNAAKLTVLPASRISGVSDILDSHYVGKDHLKPNTLYVFAGKAENGGDTWCDSVDSLIVWDKDPDELQLTTSSGAIDYRAQAEKDMYESTYRDGARFLTDETSTYLGLPHKQVDGSSLYYRPRVIELPPANYSLSTPGVVTPSYTRSIKAIGEKINNFYHMAKGKQVYYMDTRVDDDKLPAINNKWSIGDYILVRQDFTSDMEYDGVTPPSTIYVVLPGYVNQIGWLNGSALSSSTGLCLKNIDVYESRYGSNPPIPIESDSSTWPTFFDDDNPIRGIPGTSASPVDYFQYTYHSTDDDGDEQIRTYFFYVLASGPRAWSDAILLTGEIPLAQENVIGGFLNVRETDLDGGYIIRDENGHLRLLDYGLLRSGVLAYQLGEDVKFPAGISNEDIQNTLDEIVNDRVAFPNSNQSSQYPDRDDLIHVTIDISNSEEVSEIIIKDIDSRFNTAVMIHLTGSADNKTIVRIYNCEKLRLDFSGLSNAYTGTGPIVQVFNSCLYYDPGVFNYIMRCSDFMNNHYSMYSRFMLSDDYSHTGMHNISIWYDRYESSDMDLCVDGLTVTHLSSSVPVPVVSDYWTTVAANDNHFSYALKSITFSNSGEIVGFEILMKNKSTTNIVTSGYRIIPTDFELPKGMSFNYPEACITRPMVITGTFTTAYRTPSESSWMLSDIAFTATTYPNSIQNSGNLSGDAVFRITTNQVPTDKNTEHLYELAPWRPNQLYNFSGGVYS